MYVKKKNIHIYVKKRYIYVCVCSMLRKGDVVIDSLFIIARYTICNWVLIAIRSLCKSCLLNNKKVVFRISPWSYLSPFNNTTGERTEP